MAFAKYLEGVCHLAATLFLSILFSSDLPPFILPIDPSLHILSNLSWLLWLLKKINIKPNGLCTQLTDSLVFSSLYGVYMHVYVYAHTLVAMLVHMYIHICIYMETNVDVGGLSQSLSTLFMKAGSLS